MITLTVWAFLALLASIILVVWLFARLFFRVVALENECRWSLGKIRALLKEWASGVHQAVDRQKEAGVLSESDLKEWAKRYEDHERFHVVGAHYLDKWNMIYWALAEERCWSWLKERPLQTFNKEEWQQWDRQWAQLAVLQEEFNQHLKRYNEQRSRWLIRWVTGFGLRDYNELQLPVTPFLLTVDPDFSPDDEKKQGWDTPLL